MCFDILNKTFTCDLIDDILAVVVVIMVTVLGCERACVSVCTPVKLCECDFFPAVLGYIVTTYAYVFIWDLPEEFLWVVLRLTGR